MATKKSSSAGSRAGSRRARPSGGQIVKKAQEGAGREGRGARTAGAAKKDIQQAGGSGGRAGARGGASSQVRSKGGAATKATKAATPKSDAAKTAATKVAPAAAVRPVKRARRMSEDEIRRATERALKKLEDCGLTTDEKARVVGVRRETIAAWESGVAIPRGRSRWRLMNTTKDLPAAMEVAGLSEGDCGQRRRPDGGEDAWSDEEVSQLKAEGFHPAHKRASFLKSIAKRDGLKRAELADLLGVTRRSLYDLLTKRRQSPPPRSVVERMRELKNRAELGLEVSDLRQRVQDAARVLFPEEFLEGGEKGRRAPGTMKMLEELSGRTGYNTRTLHRYLPPYAKEFKPPRAVALAFEEAARLGPLSRPAPSV